MADLVITASQVLKGADAIVQTYTAGEAITAGETVYLVTTTNKVLRTDADVAASAVVLGIALNDASADGAPVTVQRSGTITLGAGAAPAAGQTYVASVAAGKIALESDLLAGDFVTVIGIGDGASGLLMGIVIQPTAHA